jgi:hypothetical protein
LGKIAVEGLEGVKALEGNLGKFAVEGLEATVATNGLEVAVKVEVMVADQLPAPAPGACKLRPVAIRNSYAVNQYIIAGGGVLRLFDERCPEQLSVFSLPCDFIFTDVKSIGWVTVSIEASKRATVYTPLGPVGSIKEHQN